MRSTTNALEEADWEEEMSLFRKRLQKPNQLETMRKIVEEVDLGKVKLATSIAIPQSTSVCWAFFKDLAACNRQ